jgi:hypothetical protein
VMPSLTELHFIQGSGAYNTQHWSASRQLNNLSLHDADVSGVGALAQLTGLTTLSLLDLPGYQSYEPLPAAGQAELGRALAGLKNLQFLCISHAPPGPVAQALSQLTSLRELWLEQQDLVRNPGPLVLPSCVKLSFCQGIPVQHLASIEAPQLRHLDGSLAVRPRDLGTLSRVCRGVLRACSSVSLGMGYAWSRQDTVALMEVLSQDWHPSAEVQQHSLDLSGAQLSRQCLSLLPRGLAVLKLK